MSHIETLLGSESESLLSHTCHTIPRSSLHCPGPDYIDNVVAHKDLKPRIKWTSLPTFSCFVH